MKSKWRAYVLGAYPINSGDCLNPPVNLLHCLKFRRLKTGTQIPKIWKASLIFSITASSSTSFLTLSIPWFNTVIFCYSCQHNPCYFPVLTLLHSFTAANTAHVTPYSPILTLPYSAETAKTTPITSCFCFNLVLTLLCSAKETNTTPVTPCHSPALTLL